MLNPNYLKMKFKSLFDKGSDISGTSLNHQRFIILGRSRVGTNFLTSMLNQHNNIKAYGELFNLGGLPKEIMHDAITHPLEYLKNKIYRHYPKHIHAVGFKIFYYHCTHDSLYFKSNNLIKDASEEMKKKLMDLYSYLENNFNLKDIGIKLEEIWTYLQQDLDLRIIHLKRRNVLKTFFSQKLAYMTNQWTSKDKRSDNEHISVHLNYKDCVNTFEQTKAWEQKFDNLFHNHKKIEVIYEDLINDKNKEIKNIVNFLGIPRNTLSSPLKKQNRKPLSEVISNYWELKEKFKNSCWIDYFED